MDPNTLPGNSKLKRDGVTQNPTKLRDPKPAVVTARVAKDSDRSLGEKLKRYFWSSEDGTAVRQTIWTDIIAPTIKTGLYGIVLGALGSIFWGPGRERYGGYTGYSPYAYGNQWGYNPFGRITYQARPTNYTDYSRHARPGQPAPQPTTQVSPTDVVFASRAEAELVKDTLSEILVTYHVVTLGDFYESCNVPVNGQTDYNVGWTDLSRLTVKERYGGWILELPRPMPIQR